MASKALATSLLLLNLLFFTTLVSSQRNCTADHLKLGACVSALNGLVNVTVGSPPVTPCCNLINGLVDLEAAACLCTAIRASVLGINLNVPISLSLVLNGCGRNNTDYQCSNQ